MALIHLLDFQTFHVFDGREMKCEKLNIVHQIILEEIMVLKKNNVFF